MLKALDVAEYFVSIVDLESQDFLTNLKVQKLLYYSQGFSLAIFRGVLFPEKIYAWQLGPVVKEVYKNYERFGASPVELSADFNLAKYDSETKDLLNEVFDVYGQFSASRLVEMTHNEPPWKNTRINNEISIKHLQDYFSKQVK
jgi:uncharacterized phage-associated protein